VAGELGILRMDVDGLDDTNEQHQQHAEHRQASAEYFSMRVAPSSSQKQTNPRYT
jgi:hypothetical protein